MKAPLSSSNSQSNFNFSTFSATNEHIPDDSVRRHYIVGLTSCNGLELVPAVSGLIMAGAHCFLFDPEIDYYASMSASYASIWAADVNGSEIKLRAKPFQELTFSFSSGDAALAFRRMLPEHLTLTATTERFFFKNWEKFPLSSRAYSPKRELLRHRAPPSIWGIQSPNVGHELSAFYAQKHILPISLRFMAPLQRSAKLRFQSRFPTYSWSCWDPTSVFHQKVLMTAGRPLFSLETSRADSPLDSDYDIIEQLYYACLCHHPSVMTPLESPVSPYLHVVDTGGEHHELTTYYSPYCKINYLSLSTHSLRGAYDDLYRCITEEDTDQLLSDSRLTTWTGHINRYLSHAQGVAQLLSKTSVIIQHGGIAYMSAPTLSSLVQLIADPYFRTLDGFLCLLEKEWLSFGHDFRDSRASGDVGGDPVYFHFVCCVWEVMQQNAHLFEFNERFLLCLLDSFDHDRFGTFCLEHDRMRTAIGTTKCPSFFTYIRSRKDYYITSLYSKSLEPLVIRRHPRISLFAAYLLRGETLSASFRGLAATMPSDKQLRTGNMNRIHVNLDDRLVASHFLTDEMFVLGDRITQFSLANNKLSVLPLSLTIMGPTLKTLKLQRNQFYYIPGLLALMKNISTLDLTHNLIAQLSFPWKSLPVLSQLRVDQNKLTSFDPRLFSHNKLLKFLTLSSNEIVTIVPSGGRDSLSALTVLDLSFNSLRTFPAFLPQALPHLNSLNLHANNLVTVPTSLGSWSSLRSLDLSNNRLASLPNTITQLKELFSLNVGDNLLFNLPVAIDSLEALEELRLTGNRLRALPPLLSNCIRLKKLFLGRNMLSKFPSIQKCVSMREIELQSNELTRVPESIAYLHDLASLNLSSNSISRLPPSLVQLENLRKLTVDNNPLVSPGEEVIALGTEAILKYLSKEFNGTRPAYESLLMFIGPQGGGKTSLAAALTSTWSKLAPSFDSNSNTSSRTSSGTRDPAVSSPPMQRSSSEGVKVMAEPLERGIAISRFTFAGSLQDKKKKLFRHKKVVKVEVGITTWDFDGFDLYAMARRIFAIKRCVYILVFDLQSQNVVEQVESILRSHLAARSRSVRIVMVGTHVDEMSPEESAAILTKIRQKLKPSLPQNSHKLLLFAVSCVTEVGIASLRVYLQDYICSRRYIGEEVPYSYMYFSRVIERVRSETSNMPVISRSQLLNTGEACGLDSSQVFKAARYLSESGSIIFFERDPLLNHFIFLDPQWLAGVMAALFKVKDQYLRGGILHHADLGNIWKQYPQAFHPALLYLLAKFEVLHVFPGHGAGVSSLVPTFSNVSAFSDRNYGSSLKRKGSAPELSPPIRQRRARTTSVSVSTLGGSPKRRETRSLSMAIELVEERGIHPLLNRPRSSTVADGKTKVDNRTASGRSVKFLQALVDSFSVNGFSLLPSLLPSLKPSQILEEKWPTTKNVGQISREFHFSFLPNGFFSRAIVRVLSLAVPIVMWSDGVLAQFQFNEDEEEEQQKLLLLELDRPSLSSEGKEMTVTLSIRGDRTSRSLLFRHSIDIFETLLMQWPKLQCQRYAIDFQAPPDGQTERGALPVRISLSQIEKAVMNGNREFFGLGSYFNISEVAPDVGLGTYDKLRVQSNQIKFTDLLGEGGFAKVYKSEYQGKEVACKVLTPPKDPKDSLQFSRKFLEFRKEVLLHCQLDHDNIVKFVGISLKPNFVIILEWVEHGTLHSVATESSTPFPWPLRLKVALDVARALRYLHGQRPRVVHLDLKAANVLVKSTDAQSAICAVLADFGTAKEMLHPTLTGRFVDNPIYLAPEILLNRPYNHKVDNYAYGVLLMEIYSRKGFFSHLQFLSQVEDRVVKGLRPTLPDFFPDFARLIQTCWHQSSNRRPPFKEIVNKLKALSSRLDPSVADQEAAWINKAASQASSPHPTPRSSSQWDGESSSNSTPREFQSMSRSSSRRDESPRNGSPRSGSFRVSPRSSKGSPRKGSPRKSSPRSVVVSSSVRHKKPERFGSFTASDTIFETELSESPPPLAQSPPPQTQPPPSRPPPTRSSSSIGVISPRRNRATKRIKKSVSVAHLSIVDEYLPSNSASSSSSKKGAPRTKLISLLGILRRPKYASHFVLFQESLPVADHTILHFLRDMVRFEMNTTEGILDRAMVLCSTYLGPKNVLVDIKESEEIVSALERDIEGGWASQDTFSELAKLLTDHFQPKYAEWIHSGPFDD